MQMYVRKNSRLIGADKTLVFLHGLGSSGREWADIIKQISWPGNIIVVDLIGFGKSPMPEDIDYTPKMQVEALHNTLQKLNIQDNLVLIGHSLGAIIAIEFGYQYPNLTTQIIACSPPIYHTQKKTKGLIKSQDEQALEIYQKIYDNPKDVVRWSPLVEKLGIVPPSFDVDHQNIYCYMSSLKFGVIKQNMIEKLKNIKVPTLILHGLLDPCVIGDNVREVTKANKYVTATAMFAVHQIRKLFKKKLIEIIDALT